MTVWLDTNVILRFLTGEPPDMAARARRLLRRASEREFVLRIPSVVVAEVVWVLGSYYDVPRDVIADRVRGLALADGIEVEAEQVVLDALRIMEDAGVAFVDGYLAAVARARGEAVATFDADFKRLGVEIVA